MKKILLMVLVLSGFANEILGSENSNEITVFKANVGTLNANPLRYCDKEYIDILNNNYGIQCAYNEPFLMIYYPWTRGVEDRWASKEEQVLRKIVEPITFVPFRHFMKDDKDPKDSISFKKQNSLLLSCLKQFANMENGFQIQLVSNFGEMNPQALLNQFKKTPRCEPGHLLNEKGKLLVFVDTTDLNKELCRENIIRPVGEFYGYACHKQQYEQWINGYFGDEIKAEQKIEQSALFYSRLKQLFIGGSIAAILMYILYQNFYTTAG